MASGEDSNSLIFSLESDPDSFAGYRQIKIRMARRMEAEKCGLDVDLVVLATEEGDADAIERLLEELEKASDETATLLNAGGSHPARRHGHVPQALINDLLAEMLYHCRDNLRVPSILLCRMVERQLGTQRHGLHNVRNPVAWLRAAKLLADGPGMSSREVAKLVGVDHTSVSRWRKTEGFNKEVESPRGYPPIRIRY